MIQRHPLMEGNEHTGLPAGVVLLSRAGYDFAAPRAEMVEMPVALAE